MDAGRTLAFWPFALTLPLIACGGGADRSRGPVVRDSAGVTIVENREPAWPEGEGWRLSETPLIDIGALEGAPEYQLFRVVGAVRLSDGRIVLANAGTHQLRFYGADGTYLGASGREGDGPGEFRDMGRLWLLPPDSLLVWDWRTRRMSVFDDRGKFARSFLLRAPGGQGLPTPVAVFPDRSLLASEGPIYTPGERRTGLRRDSVTYFRYDAEGAPLDTIGRFPGRELFVSTGEQFVIVMSRAFGRQPQLAVHGAGFYFGASDRYEIGDYSVRGALRRLIRGPHVNLRVTPEHRQRYVQLQLEGTTDEAWRARLRKLLAEMPFPETMPAYRDLVVDADGNLWVADFGPPGGERWRWTVFDGEGRMLGRVEMPAAPEIYAIGSDYVLGLWRDELDIEHVRLYQLIKP